MAQIRNLKYLPSSATFDVMDSPVGMLTIMTSPEGLHAIVWDLDWQYLKNQTLTAQFIQTSNEKNIIQTKRQLAEYFSGNRNTFDLPLVMSGTPFQIAAFQKLLEIPYGETITYAEQAHKLGNKNKARAVGLANRLNPISIIVPCHRVIGSQGTLTGFAGGIDRKAYLLELEESFK